jgi:hypothetical protein
MSYMVEEKAGGKIMKDLTVDAKPNLRVYNISIEELVYSEIKVKATSKKDAIEQACFILGGRPYKIEANEAENQDENKA